MRAEPALLSVLAIGTASLIAGCAPSIEEAISDCMFKARSVSEDKMSSNVGMPEMVICMRGHGFDLTADDTPHGSEWGRAVDEQIASVMEGKKERIKLADIREQGARFVYLTAPDTYARSNSQWYEIGEAWWMRYLAMYLLIGIVAALVSPIKSLINLEVASVSAPKARLLAFRGILLIAAVLAWPLVWMVARAKTRAPQSDWDALQSNPEFKQQQGIFDAMSRICDEYGIDVDELPGATGEFGLTSTNPIPTRTVFGTISYLAKLRTSEGGKVSYERTGSMESNLSRFPIDSYEVIDAHIKRMGTLYFSPYQKRNSKRVPRGFTQT
jgi:hypothetical protein